MARELTLALAVTLAGPAACQNNTGTSTSSTGSNSGGGPKFNGGECDARSAAGAATCLGSVCLTLQANSQGKTGLCSEKCDVQGATCQYRGLCTAVPQLNANYCQYVCNDDSFCVDGFVCVKNAGAAQGICSVTAAG